MFRSHSLLDDEAVAWLSTVDTAALTDQQRLGLAFPHRNTTITNQQYRSLTGCDPVTASRELTGMAAAGLLEKTRDRRWTFWRLADNFATGDTGESRRLQPELWPGPVDVVGSAGIRPALRRDRSAEIRTLLADGPRTTGEIAHALRLTSQGALRWLHHERYERSFRTTCLRHGHAVRYQVVGGDR
ncbi:hypothetical protein MXD62_01580 [Frankia sp. Mgl5]|uniref:hypothetical protein n=1 Tax=Frankia sp. Mgl5 TaxID=2933793 RepID=UPI00200D2DA9|nr:hypothetical protein [Frankia sp. Mgl5]MCK9925861.1 hypothetical protein [Frankia sp. Mgl5]